MGIPLPRGAAGSVDALTLRGDDESVRPLQARALDHWPDGSVRWALIDFNADVLAGQLSPLTLTIGAPAAPILAAGPRVDVREHGGGVSIDTGVAAFHFAPGAPFPLSDVVLASGMPAIASSASGFRVRRDHEPLSFAVSEIDLRARGPLRAEAVIRARPVEATSTTLDVTARVECFAGSAAVRIAITMRNTGAAVHPGGEWTLGDPGSLLLNSADLVLTLPDSAIASRVAVEESHSFDPAGPAFELYQDSSGGPAWNSRAHVNRHGQVPHAFRGYRLRTAAGERTGLRASPIVAIDTPAARVAVAVPDFWQNAPRALAVDGSVIRVGFFPGQFADDHELQGGEQKTHTVVVAFDADTISEAPLAWCHEPLRVHPDPSWYCESSALPLLALAAADDPQYQSLIAPALDAAVGFAAKQERADEYGWRDFGDLPADHESAYQPADRPFVSHYNNQYDAVAAFGMHFARTGDLRWWRLMDALARHVRDIDIYRTSADKAAYNGGLFWHTQHYMDAGTSTHRTYPKGSGGGGPSAEHNYALGLMLHYFMTGDAASRDAAIGLAEWVLDMDDGRRTPFRWLASGPTGLASATGSRDYHGPGRGPANSIMACLVARRLTGEARFGEFADRLIERCIHPADDLEARRLLDVERRWYYTVFLQTLGFYLHEKTERGENDRMYAYAQQSLLHYARWMAQHEVPYLSRPEVLEFPNETWAAQDLRKAEVFWFAAGHGRADERERFVERARFFFADASTRLLSSPTRHFTRPLVLCLRNGLHLAWFESVWRGERLWPEAREKVGGTPWRFVPQRAVAERRAKLIAGAAGAAALALVAAWFLA